MLIPLRPKDTCFHTPSGIFSILKIFNLYPVRPSAFQALKVPIISKTLPLPAAIPCYDLYLIITLRPMALHLTPFTRLCTANVLNNPLSLHGPLVHYQGPTDLP